MKKIIKKIIPGFLLGFYHYLLALTGAFIYGFPSRKMVVIGVTGTNGKSTVVEMISRVLEEAGFKTASLSSIRFRIGQKEWPNMLKMTMPGRFAIQKFLRQAVKSGCEYAVLEVTSEGIKQFRHKFIKFSAAVFTNLSSEHIESHRGFENYRRAKETLFKATKGVHIININDGNARHFLKYQAEKKYLYNLKSQISNLKNTNQKSKIIEAENVEMKPSGVYFKVENSEFHLNLLGEFNVYNAMAAICVGIWQGIPSDVCKKALEKIAAVPGRMEIVAKEPFMVVVDYAHTPEALRNVYKILREHAAQSAERRITAGNSRLICVLGSCGGGRDKWKRPVLGKLAGQYCHEIIITNEDPYDEDPMEIINQVAGGVVGKVEKILDRREAIKKALELAKLNDIVIITGKGCEPWMCVKNGEKISWDDRQIVRDYFAQK